MTLAGDVTEVLDRHEVVYALIGAHALAVHGYIRSTRDTDFLTADERVLAAAMWEALRKDVQGIYRGDFGDPLAGTVRFSRDRERVDVVVAKYKWEKAVIDRAPVISWKGKMTRVPTSADLIVLKLAAGGPGDQRDVLELLARTADSAAVARDVDEQLAAWGSLRDASELWQRVRAEAGV